MRVARVKEGERFCVAQEEWGELEGGVIKGLEETLGGVGCVCYLNYADFMDTHISKSMKLYTFCAVYFMPLLLQ